MSEKEYYNEKFWFTNTQNHNHNQDVAGYGQDYYAYKIFKNLITKINDIPEEGHIVVMGTNRCISFDLLCQHFGYDRCWGFDIANPSNHPCVTVQDCSDVTKLPDIDIAFVHNDIGSFPLTPKLKYDVQFWAAQQVVEGGYFLSRNDLNSAKFKLESLMSSHGFYNTQFDCLKGLVDLSMLDYRTVEGHMLSKKITREIW
mgnify:CR=1 FL=1